MAGIEDGMRNERQEEPGTGADPEAGEAAEIGGERREGAVPDPDAPGSPQESRPPNEPGPPRQPQAARGTTLALVVALALVVVITGALGAVAVVMTRNPDAAPLSQVSLRRLATPVHFAPVVGVKAGPCTETDAVPDDTGTTCYQLDPGITVTTVQKIEEVPERDGSHSLRLVLSPANLDQIADLTRETIKQQLAIVAGDKVVAAPRVEQEITQDSLAIAGFTKEQADALFTLLTGAAAPQASPPAQDTQPAQPTQPAYTQPQSQTEPPAFTEPTAQSTQPLFTGTPDEAATQPAAGRPEDTRATGSGGRTQQRFASCQEATANGYGPYTKGVHAEYYWYTDVDGDGVACDSGDLA
ncbi:excalibur calcium-binding domain-containing protein [Sphaerimonospora sp. CA-214678]|uniref:excalibur calcium-binding domain-containing protein n=1 Tax=Sphaerimonospora sp. CA-214678 TaxID=3240029 RepID=UPI003D8B1E1C